METFGKYFLGNADIWFHLAGLLLCLIGTILVKYHYYKKHKAVVEALDEEEKFNVRYWIKKNGLEVGIAMLASFILVRFVDVLLYWANSKFSLDIPVTKDQIFYYLVAAVLIQWYAHKNYRQ